MNKLKDIVNIHDLRRQGLSIAAMPCTEFPGFMANLRKRSGIAPPAISLKTRRTVSASVSLAVCLPRIGSPDPSNDFTSS